MIVVSIIGILASISLPHYHVYQKRTEVTEALTLATTIREDITAFYMHSLTFPRDNNQAGVPAPDKLISNRVSQMVIEDGALHITLGNKIAKNLRGKVLSFRPATVDGSPVSPISWLCGYDQPIEGHDRGG